MKAFSFLYACALRSRRVLSRSGVSGRLGYGQGYAIMVLFCLSVSLSYNTRGVRMRVMTSIVYTLLNRGEDANNDRW